MRGALAWDEVRGRAPAGRERCRVVPGRPPVLRELWEYRELFYFFVWRDVKVRYRQTVLGVGWALVQPLLATLICTVVFGRLAKASSEVGPYPLFAYSAMLAWTYFATAVTFAANSLVNYANVFTKVYFPRLVLPAAPVLSGLVDFAVASVVLIGLAFYYGATPGWALLLVPYLLVVEAMLALGLGSTLAALTLRLRDVRHALPFLMQLWLLATPVLYPAAWLPAGARWVAVLNPMSGLVGAFRYALTGFGSVDGIAIAWSVVVAAVTCVAGVAYFQWVERSFADLV